MRSRSPIVRNAAIAAIAGSIVGGAAGVLSLRAKIDSAPPPDDPPAAVATPAPPAAETLAHRVPAPVAVPTGGVVRDEVVRADEENVLVRARALAQRPDVKALVALRDDLARRAGERGESEAPDTKRLLEEMDRHLTDARALRLKLDGDELRRATRP